MSTGSVEAGARQGTHSRRDLLGDGRTTTPPAAEDVDDRDGLVLFTSGTTGLPKAIGITNGQLTARTRGVAAPFRADIAPTVSMMSVPYFHVGGAVGLIAQSLRGQHLCGASRVSTPESGCVWCRSTV